MKFCHYRFLVILRKISLWCLKSAYEKCNEKYKIIIQWLYVKGMPASNFFYIIFLYFSLYFCTSVHSTSSAFHSWLDRDMHEFRYLQLSSLLFFYILESVSRPKVKTGGWFWCHSTQLGVFYNSDWLTIFDKFTKKLTGGGVSA